MFVPIVHDTFHPIKGLSGQASYIPGKKVKAANAMTTVLWRETCFLSYSSLILSLWLLPTPSASCLKSLWIVVKCTFSPK